MFSISRHLSFTFLIFLKAVQIADAKRYNLDHTADISHMFLYALVCFTLTFLIPRLRISHYPIS